MQMPTPAPKQFAVIPTDRQMSFLRYRPDGRQLLAAGRDGKIHRWDVSEPVHVPADASEPSRPSDTKPVAWKFAELPPLIGHDGWVTQIALSAQSPYCFSADSWGRLIAWSSAAEPPQPVWNIPSAHDGWLRQMALSPDGTKLATCGKDRAIRLWNAADGKLLQDFGEQTDDVFSLAFHPDGQSLVSGDLKGVARHWDLTENKVVREFDARILYMLSWIQDVGGVRVLAFDSQGKSLAVAGTQPTSGGFVQGMPTVKFFDWAGGQETQSLKLGENTEGFIHDLLHHPDGYWIGVTSGQPGRGSVFFQRPGEDKPFVTQALPNCHSLAISPDGRQLAVLANEGTYGQAKSMAREGVYPGNTSPIHLFDMNPPAA